MTDPKPKCPAGEGLPLKIPADMNNVEAARELGAEAVVSIRDMLILLGEPPEDDWEP